MKFSCASLFILTTIVAFAMSVDLQCYYEHESWLVVGSAYSCYVQNNLNLISSESAIVTGAGGSHASGKNNDNVHGFYAKDKKIQVFPRGLEAVFKNLKAIYINYGRLTEIHQTDLKPFAQLQNLDFYENDIEFLEEGLFEFNPKLGLIAFSYNKISQIHPTIFDHLDKLTYLWLNRNQCINKVASGSSTAVKEVIKEAKLKCPRPSIFYKKVHDLKTSFDDSTIKLVTS